MLSKRQPKKKPKKNGRRNWLMKRLLTRKQGEKLRRSKEKRKQTN